MGVASGQWVWPAGGFIREGGRLLLDTDMELELGRPSTVGLRLAAHQSPAGLI